jgi:hypothetical protein
MVTRDTLNIGQINESTIIIVTGHHSFNTMQCGRKLRLKFDDDDDEDNMFSRSIK